MPNQLEPQATTQSQVVADTFGQPIHREPSGQGNAKVCKAVTSTLA